MPVNSENLLALHNKIGDGEIDQFLYDNFTHGLHASDIVKLETQYPIKSNTNRILAVCAMHNSNILIRPYIEHYNSIGVSDFVFIDNNSNDNSIELIQNHNDNTTRIDLWHTYDKFDGFKAMGWKQRLFDYYGLNRWYLNLDIDEHLVYPDCEKIDIHSVAARVRKIGHKTVSSMLVDMYSNTDVRTPHAISDLLSLRSTYNYFDKNTYFAQSSEKYNYRIWGGPRTRKFNRHPSLQKYPLAYVDASMMAVNPHFWFPYTSNKSNVLIPETSLLHYKFLPGDIEKYQQYVDSGVHWDNSSQYKSYLETIRSESRFTFFDIDTSVEYLGSQSLKNIYIHEVR